VSYQPTPYTIAFHPNQKDPNNVAPMGEAMLNGGLCQIASINGFGLVTNGFLWQGNAIWFDANSFAPIATTWAATGLSLTTGWTAAYGYQGSSFVIQTSWSASQSFADEYPS
jgi:hypothetical protein